MNIRWIVVVVGLAAGLISFSGCSGDDDAAATPTSVRAVPSATGPTATATPARPPVITIDAPAAGGMVSVPFLASGTSNTFEAALTVDVIDSTGGVRCRRHVMATSGSGTPGTWQASLAFPPPDAETAATFRAYELSAQDGTEINIVEQPITISPEHPALYITSPGCLATLAPGRDLFVNGRGLVFEAVFILQLRNASGAAVIEQRAMAGGTEELDFTVALSIPADLTPGLYDLVAFNYSARDGAIENEFSVQVIVPPVGR